MKKLVLIDRRKIDPIYEDWNKKIKDAEYEVKQVVNTIDYMIGQKLSIDDVNTLLMVYSNIWEITIVGK